MKNKEKKELKGFVNFKLLLCRSGLLLLLSFALITSLTVYADGGMNMEFNNRKVMNANDIRVVNGASYVNAEKMARILHLNYYWQENTQTLYLSKIKDSKEIILYFENDDAEIFNEYEKRIKESNPELFEDLDQLILSPEKIKKEREKVINQGLNFDKEMEKEVKEGKYISENNGVFIPLRFVSSELNLEINWDDYSKTILLRSVDSNLLPKRDSYRIKFTDDDLYLMAKLVGIEARDGSINKKLAVANVILNRVESSRFPNTIAGVVFQSGQFPPAHWDSFPNEVPSADALLASKKALYNERAELNGVKMPNNVLFFNYIPFSSKSADELFGNIEGDYFYY